jgi:lipopolysaccharide export system permease protein
VKKLNKYVLLEHAGPLMFALSALTSLLLLNYIAKQFGNLVGKGLSWMVIVEFLGLSVPFTVAMTLPMAVLVATLYAFSRLAAENEITAMKASGVGLGRLMVPVLIGASVISLIMLAFNDQILPAANHRLATLQRDIARKKPTFALREQVINPLSTASSARLYLRANRIDRGTNLMRDVTIYDLTQPLSGRTVYADSGTVGMSENQTDLILTLYDGHVVELSRAEPGQLQRMYYQEYQVRVGGVANELERSEQDGFRSDRERTICDMQQEYVLAEQDYRRSRHLLQQAQDTAGRTSEDKVGAITPEAEEGDEYVHPPPSLSIGRIYCAATGLLASAFADPPPDTVEVAPGTEAGEPNGGETIYEDNATVAIPPSTSALPPAMGSPRAGRPAGLGGPVGSAISDATGIESARALMQANLLAMNAYGVEIHKKFSLAAACIVFVLLGAPIALRFPRGGVGLVIGVSLVVFALSYMGLIGGEALAKRGDLSPGIAMWGANIILTAIGLFLLARMGRESSTARGGDMGELLDGMRSYAARIARKFGLQADRRRAR